jgi:hypothetical protein
MLAMIFLVLFATLSLAFYTCVTISVQIASNERSATRAMTAAESGATFVRYQLESLNLPFGTTPKVGTTMPSNVMQNLASSLANLLDASPNMGGKPVVVSADKKIYLPSSDGWITLDAAQGTRFRAIIEQPDETKFDLLVTIRGASQNAKVSRGIRTKYQRAPGVYALVGIESITMSGAAYTDSYDSSKNPTYSAATARKNGSIASNGNITLSGTSRVNGDARPGVGRVLTLQDTASLTGRSVPLAQNPAYPSVTLPPGATSLGAVSHTSGTFNQPGGTYVLDSLTLKGDTVINWQGPVTLYIKGAYSVEDNVVINTYKNLPQNRKLYFLPTCTTATWSGNNICVGELYAPDTNFTISGSVQKFGKITAKTIKNSSTGGMHADEALLDPSASGGYVPVQGTYTEVP